MGDLLKYRFPGEEPVHRTGFFRERLSVEQEKSFVLYSFNKDVSFRFEEAEIEGQIHYSSNIPEIYSEAKYLRKAQEFKDELIDRGLSKAIFSRVKRVEMTPDPEVLFQRLCEEYPKAFVYLASGELFGTWIGASPEPLLSSYRGKASTVALAGTMKASDREKWGDKEKKEQQYVVDFISEQLTKEEVQGLEIVGPEEFLAGPVKHLRSSFRFSIRDMNALDIALRLHPTPAVSGLPVLESIQLIRDVEAHDRLLYAGIVGQIGRETQLFVNLRCAQLFEDFSCLYLGGGFTKDSDVEMEWQETENKAKTLLNVMNNL